jgi:hypothetical protein
MPSTTSLWRTALFGAAGTGFKDDTYLTDGQHLRWHVSGQLGLPFESAGRRVGAFRIYHRTGGASSIKSLALIGGASGGTFPIYDGGAFDPAAGLVVGCKLLN